MAGRLTIELSGTEVSHLASMTNHPGWEVYAKITSMACQQALAKVAAIDPTDPEAAKRIVAAQSVAYATKEFLDLVGNTVEWEINEAMAAQEPEEAVNVRTSRSR